METHARTASTGRYFSQTLFTAVSLWMMFLALRADGQAVQAAARTPTQQEVDVVRRDDGKLVPSTQPPASSAPPGDDAGAISPPRLAQLALAPYPEELAGSGVGGSVVLELLVSESGAVADVVLVQGAHPLLDAAAKDAARGLHFAPATHGGVPVAVRVHFTYEFQTPGLSKAEECTLHGEVRTRGNRRPIAGAVLLEGERVLGETDADGRFRLSMAPGAHTVLVRAAGHRAAQFTESLAAGDSVSVVYRLEPEVASPYETVVVAERARAEVVRHTLVEQEVREVPGTMGDPFRVVLLMPGVATMASGLSYPVVRGSQPAATTYLMDGVRVPSLFHLGLGPAVVHPDFLDRLDFFPGSPPVRYGRQLGGVVEGHASRPRDDRMRASAYADIINAGGFVESTLPSTGTQVTLAGRFSFTAWALALLADATNLVGRKNKPIADFWDYQARVEQPIGAGRLRLLALGSSDLFGNDQESPQETDSFLEQRFHRVDLRYRRPTASGAELEAGLTWGTEDMGMSARQGVTALGEYALRADELSVRASLDAPLSSTLQLALGADAQRRIARSSISIGAGGDGVEGEVSAFHRPQALGTYAGAWGELTWRPNAAWTVTAGARGDSFHLVPGVQRWALEPRVAIRHQLSPGLALKAGGGITHQAPTVLVSVPMLDAAGLRYGLQEAQQFDAGAEWSIASGLEFGIDGYFSHLTRTFEFDLQQVLDEPRRQGLLGEDLAGSGRAYGLEFLLRHPLGGGWFGWISYSMQRSERRTAFIDLERYRAEGVAVWKVADLPFAFDQTHVLNAAMSVQLAHGWTVGGGVHFNSGRPESGLISSRTARVVSDEAGAPLGWASVSLDQVDRLPGFFRVDARVSRTWTFDDHRVELYLDILNASVGQEVLGYEYRLVDRVPQKQAMGFPVVVPMLGVKGTY